MKHRYRGGGHRDASLALAACAALAFCTAALAQDWRQFGGPNGNFTVETKGLADAWPEGGPKQIWHRELGDGYGTILADSGALYAMYRIGQDEFTVALDAGSGATLWEHKVASPTTDLMKQYGAGPSSTPLVVGDKLYSIGTNMIFQCFDKKTGKVNWKHDLVKEYGAKVPGRGYCSSPLFYKGTVILQVGTDDEDEDTETDEEDDKDEDKDKDKDEDKDKDKDEDKDREGQALMAFDANTGSVAWKAHNFKVTHSSPVLINFAGEDQLVVFFSENLVGLNPGNGDVIWQHSFGKEYANLSSPVFNGKDILFCSAAYDSGARAIRLKKEGGKTVPEELWYSRKFRIHHADAIILGDYAYGSSGDFGPAFFMAMNLETGKVAWRKRGFKKATCVYGDGKMILLDEDGEMALTTATPDGLTVHSQCKVGETYAWAAPTLVGTKLYVRDRKHITAFDVGVEPGSTQ